MQFRELLFGVLVLLAGPLFASDLLGLPALPVPENNPQTEAKIALGDKLFNDTRFSSTGDISCATCHDASKGLTDSPLKVSSGINKLQGTRNAPTVANAAFNKTQFWDGRSPDLEDQAQHPFVNPVEMGLANHEPILEVVRKDRSYRKAFKEVFGKSARKVTIKEVQQAIAAFERTQIFGNSPFDRWFFAGEQDAISDAAKRGFNVFLNEGRCVSCHTIEQNFAIFTDHRFHNIGVGINELGDKVTPLA
ncbi:MAG: cytochrome-c peroxidase, partial [Pseudomonadales bacterium]